MAENEPQPLDIRAGEYVLGLLDELDAGRFETQLAVDPEARGWLDYWEQRLAALGLALAPVEPPASVWAGIAATIKRRGGGQKRKRYRSPGRAAGFWRGLAVAASIAAIVLAAALFLRSPQRAPRHNPAAQPAYASVIHDQQTGMSWLITASAGSHKMSILAMGDYALSEGKILRAWLKPDHGKPILLGKLPASAGQYELTVSDAAAKSMDQPAKLLVSREDSRYAGTPTPHGEVMWSSPVARRRG